MEDSGIDSDPKLQTNESDKDSPVKKPEKETKRDLNGLRSVVLTKQPKSTAQLQRRIEKRIEQAHRLYPAASSTDPQSRKGLIPISRLHVPPKTQTQNVNDGAEQPLVSWESDSEDEFEFQPRVSHRAAQEITLQLKKDGFDLDLSPYDEDLDLIPPRPLNQRCTCCRPDLGCIIL